MDQHLSLLPRGLREAFPPLPLFALLLVPLSCAFPSDTVEREVTAGLFGTIPEKGLIDPGGELAGLLARYLRGGGGMVRGELHGVPEAGTVFITKLDRFPPEILYGRGENIFDSLQDAISRTGDEGGEGFGEGAVLVDLVTGVEGCRPDLPRSMKMEDAGLSGIFYIGGWGEEFSFILPWEFVCRELYDGKKRAIRREKMKSLLKGRVSALPHPLHIEVRECYFTIETESLLLLPDGGGRRVVRGRVIPERVDGRALMAAAASGGDYLIRIMDDNGRFIYRYNPILDRASSSYNMLRHSGTLYAMLQLYERTRKEALLKAVRKGIEYALLSTLPTPPHIEGVDFLFVKSEGKAKLGGSALLLLALSLYTKITGDRVYLPAMERLARFIIFMQKESGKFKSYFQFDPSRKVKQKDSIYYPGEAILSLISLYRVTGEKAYLQAAYQAADYLIHKRDWGKFWFNLPHDHWLMMGLRELCSLRRDGAWLKHMKRLGKAIRKKQRRGKGKTMDWDGSFYTPPSSTPCSTRLEGLSALIDLLEEEGEGTSEYRESARRALRFLLSTQYEGGSQYFTTKPDMARGGVREGVFDPDVRIDYVQHAISGFIGMADRLR